MDALCVGRDADAVGAELEHLLADPQQRKRMAGAAAGGVYEGRGAVQRTLEVIRADMPPVERQDGP